MLTAVPASAAAEAAAAEALPCDIVAGSWLWQSLPMDRKELLGSLPFFSAEVVIRSGQGPVQLRLSLQAPAPEAAADAPPSSRKQAASSLPLDLGVVCVPVTIAGLPMRTDGYAVRSMSSQPVAVRIRPQQQISAAAAEPSIPDGDEGVAAPAPPGRPMTTEVICREEDELELEVQLLDEQGEPLGDTPGTFQATCPTLTGEWQAGRTLVAGPGGKLSIALSVPRAPRGPPDAALAVAADDTERGSPSGAVAVHRMTLEPSVARVQPLLLLLLVKVRRKGW